MLPSGWRSKAPNPLHDGERCTSIKKGRPMSPMRVGLIGIGVLIIIAVWLFNKYQERRIARGLEGRFASDSSDVLLSGQDGVDDDGQRRDGTLRRTAGERFEPRIGEPAEPHALSDEPLFLHPESAQPTLVRESIPVALLDPVIHAVMTLSTDTALPGEKWLQALHPLRHAGRHQVVVEGDTAFGPSALDAAQRYSTVRIGVQLANRSGALNEIEFSEFVAALQQQAEVLGALCEAPEMMETIAAARALDARCAPLDASIGINVACPEGSWPVSRVVEVARNFGLTARTDHRFVSYDANNNALFTLQDGDGGALLGEQAANSTGRITFLLEVPRAPQHERPFERMQEAALAFAAQLSGVVVDDQLRTLTEPALAGIGRQIEPVYQQLESQGLTAGSARALALFR
jgi:hypothetical protein